MRILFITPSFYPNIGGVETHVRQVSKILSKKGHKVTIVSASKINYPKIKFIGLLFIWLWFLKNLSLVTGSDIVHIHDVFIWYLPLRFLLPKKPVFITFHGYETKFPPAKKAILVRKLSEKLSWGNICVGDYIKKWYGTKATYTTYGGVQKLPTPLSGANIINTTNKNKKLKILFIGRLEEDTGINTYLKTLQILENNRIDFDFVACGDGSLRSNIQRWGKVNGFVEDLTAYIAGSDLVFSSSYLSILEAMVNKKLVFAVYNNSLKEDYLKMAPFAKWVIIENSVKALVKKIMYYLNTQSAKKKLTDEAYQWVKNQTWDEVAKIYESFYRHYSSK